MEDGNGYVRICDQCATSLANDDWTWVDGCGLSEDEAEEELARMHTYAQFLSPAHPIEPMADPGHTWECWICAGTEYASGWTGAMR